MSCTLALQRHRRCPSAHHCSHESRCQRRGRYVRFRKLFRRIGLSKRVADTGCGKQTRCKYCIPIQRSGPPFAVVTAKCFRTIQIPVFVGSNNSLLGSFDFDEKLKTTNYHGSDGLGNVISTYWTQAPYASIQSRQRPEHHAAVMLVEMFKASAERSQPLTLLALGPLTNVAIAFRLDSKFGSCLREEVLIMGGGYAGRGNITAVAEHNFAMDPEAAQATLTALRTAPCRTLLFGLEVCQEGAIEWSWLKEYVWHGRTVPSQFLANTFKWLFGVYEQRKLGPRYFLYDEWLAAYLRDPDIVERSVRWPTTVELSGQSTRGMCVVEKRVFYVEKADAEGCNNIRHVVSMNVSRMKAILSEVAGPQLPVRQLAVPAEPARKKSSVAEAVARDFSSYLTAPND